MIGVDSVWRLTPAWSRLPVILHRLAQIPPPTRDRFIAHPRGFVLKNQAYKRPLASVRVLTENPNRRLRERIVEIGGGREAERRRESCTVVIVCKIAIE